MKMEAATTATEGRAAAGNAILEVKNVEVVFNDVILVLRGLSLEARRGGITALLGANGAGKSTTLKAISGLLAVEDGAITRGSISFDGEEITRLPPNRIVHRGIFQVMEGRGIVQDMTVIENLRLGAHTRPSTHVGEDMERVFAYFPRCLRLLSAIEGAHRARGLSVGWRAANAGDRPRADGKAAPDPDGRALHGTVALAGAGGFRHHPPP